MKLAVVGSRKYPFRYDVLLFIRSLPKDVEMALAFEKIARIFRWAPPSGLD